jgi:hypothetical protein
MTLRRSIAILAIGLMALLVACSDEGPDADLLGPPNQSVLEGLSQQVRAVPGVLVDVPEARPPWDSSDAALVEQLKMEDGLAIVAFKDPGSSRLGSRPEPREVYGREYRSHFRSPVSEASIRAGLELLHSQDVEITRFLPTLGAAIVRLEPTLGPVLRKNGLVDFSVANHRLGRW